MRAWLIAVLTAVLTAVLALAGLPALTGSATAAPTTATAAPTSTGDELTLGKGLLRLTVQRDPFALTVTQRGRTVLSTQPAGNTSLVDGYAPLAHAVGAGAAVHQLGYGLDLHQPLVWFHATAVTSAERSRDELRLTVATDDPTGRTWEVTATRGVGGRIDLDARLSDTTGVIGTAAAFEHAADQHYLGLGERSDAADQTGRTAVSWNEEGPFSAGMFEPLTAALLGDRWQGPEPFSGSNFTMPWFVSSRGYGVHLRSTWLNFFELASVRDDAWRVVTRQPRLRLEVYPGPTPAQVVRRFTAAQGRQPAPAEWFFGPWIQSSAHPPAWFRERDVPTTVWQTYVHYLPCAAQTGQRERLRAENAAWHRAGLKVTTYVNSFVCSGHPGGAYEDGDANGWFIRTRTGQTYPTPYVAYLKQDGLWHGVVDFTSAAAGEWWRGLIAEAIEDGYDGWMEDFGEYVQPDAVTSDGRSGLEYHNQYCTDYHRVSHELTWPRRGRDFAQFVRCGYTGTPRWSRIVWGADPSEEFSKADGLGAAVQQALSIGASGVGYWGSDIGGYHALFQDERTGAELQKRWVQFGALSGIMRTQQDGYPRPGGDATYSGTRAEVWDPEVLPVYRKYTKLRTQLFPELWRAAQAYQRSGIPMMRHLALAFPRQAEVWSPEAEYSFMLGSELLVAPVVEEGARSRTLYLPEGRWVPLRELLRYDDRTGAFEGRSSPTSMRGGRVVTVAAPLDEIPVFVRAGRCLTLLDADVDTLAPATDPTVQTLEGADTRRVCS